MVIHDALLPPAMVQFLVNNHAPQVCSRAEGVLADLSSRPLLGHACSNKGAVLGLEGSPEGGKILCEQRLQGSIPLLSTFACDVRQICREGLGRKPCRLHRRRQCSALECTCEHFRLSERRSLSADRPH